MRRTALLCRAGAALVLAGSALIAAAAPARMAVVALDSARSSAEFHAKLFWLIDMSGEFGAVAGTVRIDHFRSQAVVDATIDANAVHMQRPGAADWARSPEFFDAAHYPQIHFVSDAFPLIRLDKGGDVAGTLTLRGISRPVVFKVAPSVCDEPAFACPVVAEGSISRSDFGMRSRRLTLSDTIELGFTIYARAAIDGGDPS